MSRKSDADAALAQWLTRLEALHPSEIELGLERVSTLVEALGLARPAPQVVTVAGTNGKGSTIAVLEWLLQRQGLRTGAYTSPHLCRFNERVRVDGVDCDAGALCAALEKVDAARGDTALTFFEFTTLAALQVFAAAGLDVVLLEVGLGGRLDAVNCIDPDLAVITSIDLDHQDWLGDDRESIAREKAGILRAGIPAVISDRAPPNSLLSMVDKLGVTARFIGDDFDLRDAGAQWSLHCGEITHAVGKNNLPPDSNAAALAAFQLLGYAFEPALLRDMQAIALAGRNQRFDINGVQVLLDVAHNPAAATRLKTLLPTAGRRIAVFAALADKDWQAIVDDLGPAFDAWFLAELPSVARALPASRLADALAANGQGMLSVSKNPRQALARALQVTAPGDAIVVFGSFHTVGAVLETVREKSENVDG